jgi:predicted protein tyrosine phosphatase
VKPNILFVCGRNRWRSPTAERIYRRDERVRVRSAGISDKSPHTISRSDLEWADLVLVMEREHKSRIAALFPGQPLPPVESLDIPDDYEYMEAELISLIQSGTEPYIAKLSG